MYSMSTETVQSLPMFVKGNVVFWPIVSGVRYEFLPLESEQNISNLLEAWELEAGKEYQMVISNQYGMIRYIAYHPILIGNDHLIFFSCFQLPGFEQIRNVLFAL